MKRLVYTVSMIALAACIGVSQSSDTVLATATGFSFTANDLSPEGRSIYDQREQLIVRQRALFFENWVNSLLLETEAKLRGVTSAQVRADAIAKIPPATEAQIKELYEANRQRLGSSTIEQVRPQIVDFLKHDAEDKQIAELERSLKAKHRFQQGKGVNTPELKALDIVGTIGERKLTASEFEENNKLRLHNFRAALYENIRTDLEASIFEKLIVTESKKRNVDASTLIATEITNKMKDFTDYERAFLEDAFQTRLFEQYRVNFNLGAPGPLVLNVSGDDDPALGSPTAKVTVVSFVDFQCSACAAFSPMLKEVVKEFGVNARLIVRDFPLVSIHHDALSAALAGFAANKQGKFFEMVDLMYGNQGALDPESLRKYARQLGMNVERFDADMKSPAAAAEVRKDIDDANSYGVSGTPTIFVNGVQVHRLSPGGVRSAIKQAMK